MSHLNKLRAASTYVVIGNHECNLSEFYDFEHEKEFEIFASFLVFFLFLS